MRLKTDKRITVLFLTVIMLLGMSVCGVVYAKYSGSFTSGKSVTVCLKKDQASGASGETGASSLSIIEVGNDKFIKLEYLEVQEPGAYIDTGITYHETWGMDVLFAMGNPSGSQYFVGARTEAGGSPCSIALAASGTTMFGGMNDNFEIWYENTKPSGNSTEAGYTNVEMQRIKDNKYFFTSSVTNANGGNNLEMQIINQNTSESVSGAVYPDTVSTHRICLFGISPTCVSTVGTRIYSVVFKDANNEVTHHFVPAAKITTFGYVYGMFDTVENHFYGNSGSGSFTTDKTIFTTVTLDSDDGNFSDDDLSAKGWIRQENGTAKKEYIIGDTLHELPTVTKVGSIFKGWQDTNNSICESNTVINSGIVLKPMWEEESNHNSNKAMMLDVSPEGDVSADTSPTK